MAARQAPPSQELVESAIARVLAAEAAAREAIGSAMREADAALEAARSRARAIAERADRRISGVREGVERRIAARREAVREAAARLAHESGPTPEEIGRLEAAVRALAAELTSPGPR